MKAGPPPGCIAAWPGGWVNATRERVAWGLGPWGLGAKSLRHKIMQLSRNPLIQLCRSGSMSSCHHHGRRDHPITKSGARDREMRGQLNGGITIGRSKGCGGGEASCARFARPTRCYTYPSPTCPAPLLLRAGQMVSRPIPIPKARPPVPPKSLPTHT